MKRIVTLSTFIVFLIALSTVGWSQSTGPIAYVIPIHGEIEPSRMIFVRRGIEKAEAAGAEYIVFDIDTFGGRVDSALQIATLIGSARSATTIAFVPAAAEGTGVSWSAGALISFACNEIYMAPGTSIGAAAPVYQTQTGMEMADEKTVSAVRTQMAALAEKNGYPKSVAFAMVDLDIELVEVYLDDDIILTSTDDIPDLVGHELPITTLTPTRHSQLFCRSLPGKPDPRFSSSTMCTRAPLCRRLACPSRFASLSAWLCSL